ncbi:N-acetylglucosaminyl phosphatidylinositol deacetylase [Candidatus Magnetobacterium bavaricum]|uniref:N-acetylglucosaminyl phosphatidylinositol deacetylase n=1 Tax=Candidatus Magnetobacterium bavaricum TaxID=29290 RepID=A0A0F3GRR1_9BACT|nr:N-acetylglucosaminyl phosphatidylinositol deacetylase [Candidatus Magnetobacterium bavaricum]
MNEAAKSPCQNKRLGCYNTIHQFIIDITIMESLCMKQRLNESDILPFYHVPPLGANVLVLAPHPDDETLGIGGTLRTLMEAGKRVSIAFVTSGDKADPDNPLSAQSVYNNPAGAHFSRYALFRETEAQKALSILSSATHMQPTVPHLFLRYPDREVSNCLDDCLKRLKDVVAPNGKALFDTLYSPSPIELHPDHRATATIALQLQRYCGITVAFYEVTVPLRPNTLIDITQTIVIKQMAIAAYESQLKTTDYCEFITSLNRMRALTLGRSITHAEALLVLRNPWDEQTMNEWFSYRCGLDVAL